MPAHVDPTVSGSEQHRSIELQCQDGGSTSRRQSFDSQPVVNPAKVSRPDLATRMKQRGTFASQRINCRRATGFSFIAWATAQAKILTHRQTAERFGNRMINLERHADNRD